MPVKRRSAKTRTVNAATTELTPTEWAFLAGLVRPADADGAAWWSLNYGNELFREDRPSISEMWAAFGADIIDLWAVNCPGNRPSLWWCNDAPEPQRRRLGGIGVPEYERTGTIARLDRGVPAEWLRPDGWAAGRGLDRYLVSLADPPAYESEATYLRRHGLLLPGELKRLVPADFAPWRVGDAVYIPADDDGDGGDDDDDA